MKITITQKPGESMTAKEWDHLEFALRAMVGDLLPVEIELEDEDDGTDV